MIDIILFIWLIILSYWLGNLIKRILQLVFLSSLEQFLLSEGLGLGILSYFTFLLGAGKLFYKSILWGIFIIISIIFIIRNYKKISLCRKVFNPHLFKKKLFFKFFLLIYLFIILVSILAPPTFWDVVVYHLAVPKLYIQQHRIFDVWHIAPSNFPFLMEMLYTLGLLLKGETLASLFHFGMGVLTALAIYSFGKRFFSKDVGFFAAIIFYTMPLQATLASGAFNDLGLVFFSFLSFYLFFIWREEQKLPYLITSAIFAGFGCGVKYFGLLVIFLLSVGIILRLFKEKTILKNLSLFLLISALTALPWYLKNFLYTGDPFFPLSYELLKYHLPVIVSKNLNAVLHLFPLENSLKTFKDYLLYPFNLTLRPDNFDGWLFSPGPLYLIFLPLLFFSKSIDKKIKYSLLYCLGFLVIFFLMQVSWSRHISFIFPLLSIISAYSLTMFCHKDLILKRVSFSILYLAVILNLGFVFVQNSIRIPVALRIESKDKYLSRRVDPYPVIRYINKNLPDLCRILVFDPRVYYLDKKYILADPLYNPYLDYAGMKNAEEFLKWMEGKNITHILINYNYEQYALKQLDAAIFYKPMLRLRDALAEKHLKLLYQERRTYLYEVMY